MNTIWKYPLSIIERQSIDVPGELPMVVRHVGADPAGLLCLWIEVDPSAVRCYRDVFVLGTGHPIPADAGAFVGSAVIDPFVWHVFFGARDAA